MKQLLLTCGLAAISATAASAATYSSLDAPQPGASAPNTTFGHSIAAAVQGPNSPTGAFVAFTGGNLPGAAQSAIDLYGPTTALPQVPVPASLPLALGGLALLPLVRRRKTKG